MKENSHTSCTSICEIGYSENAYFKKCLRGKWLEWRYRMAVLYLTTENFDDMAVKAEKLVLIDFYADWCGPCKMLAPIIEELAEERKDILVCKCNTQDEPMLAKTYGIMSIPTLMIMKQGNVLEKSVGFQNKEAIVQLISKHQSM